MNATLQPDTITDAEWRHARADQERKVTERDLNDEIYDADLVALLHAGATDAQIGLVVREVHDAMLGRFTDREMYGESWGKSAAQIADEMKNTLRRAHAVAQFSRFEVRA